MKIKSRLAISLALISLATALGISVGAVTLYAPDGRTINLTESDAKEFCKVGWFREPFVSLYAPDGRTISVLQSEVPLWTAVGWFEEPFEVMEAPDGRTITVLESQVTTWENVGWYVKNPTIYCFNQSKKTTREALSSYTFCGWSTQKPTLVPKKGNFYASFDSYNDYCIDTVVSSLVNNSNKTIKYVTFTFVFYNKVGDVIDRYKAKYIGPVEPNHSFDVQMCYNDSEVRSLCRLITISDVEYEFMDGTVSNEWCGMVIKCRNMCDANTSFSAHSDRKTYISLWDGTVVNKYGTVIS